MIKSKRLKKINWKLLERDIMRPDNFYKKYLKHYNAHLRRALGRTLDNPDIYGDKSEKMPLGLHQYWFD